MTDTIENLQAWTMPDSYMGETYYDYYYVCGQSRDSSTVERANYIAFWQHLTQQDVDFIEVRASHWAVGWVEHIMVLKTTKQSDLTELDEMVGGLSDYPVLCDETLSEIERDEMDKVYEQDVSVAMDSISHLSLDDTDTDIVENLLNEIFWDEVEHDGRNVYSPLEDINMLEVLADNGMHEFLDGAYVAYLDNCIVECVKPHFWTGTFNQWLEKTIELLKDRTVREAWTDAVQAEHQLDYDFVA